MRRALRPQRYFPASLFEIRNVLADPETAGWIVDAMPECNQPHWPESSASKLRMPSSREIRGAQPST